MSTPSYDVIVAGLGGMGSAALFELARRGRRALGLEQFDIAHDRGSSHGRTRIIRTAYYEHPGYVPLVRRAFARWRELEQLSGKHLLTPCDCLSIGPPDGELIAGVRRAAGEHGLAVENLTAAGLAARFPAFRFGADTAAVLEHEAGVLAVEECVRAHVEQAARAGAEVRTREPVRAWEADGAGVRVTTDRGAYRAARLVLTAGPWAGQLLGRWGVRLTLMRQVAFWFAAAPPEAFRRDRFPVFIADTPQGAFYGFPLLDNAEGLKLARHYGAPECSSPEEIDRGVTEDDERPLRAFLAAHLPGANGERRGASVCTYTLTPDRHFVIAPHPDHPQVAVAAGFSGHGFKFAPAVGEILADLAEKGHTEQNIEMFCFDRFGERRGSPPPSSGERRGSPPP